MPRTSVFIVVLAVLFISTGLHAQSYDNPGLGQKPVSAHPRDFKPLGIRAGSFMLHPGVELAAQYLDNILYTQDNTISDLIWHVRPYITAQSNWSKHSFSIRAAADIARYSDYGFRDYEDYFLQMGGHIDVMSRSSFSYGLDYMQLHEERNIRSAEQGISPTVYTLLGGLLGYDHTFNRFSIGLLYDFRQLSYDNNYNLDGELIDNSDRDRTQQALSATFGYQFRSDKQAFFVIGYNETDYDLDVDRSGYNRDSSGYHLGAGIDFSITSVLSGDLSVNYLQREYDDIGLPDTSGWGLGAGLHWLPTTLTSVHFNVVTSIEDTTQATSSGYLRTLYSVRVDHELMRDLQIMGQLSYTDNEYQLLPNAPEGARESDKYFIADIGATYFFNRSVWLSASYKYGNFDTNVENDDFKANSAWLVLGLER